MTKNIKESLDEICAFASALESYDNLKTAKMLFEELGYEQQILSYDNDDEIDEIIYIRNNGFASNVTFRLNNKCFKVHRKDERIAGWCDIPLLQAINKQIEGLGWLDGKDIYFNEENNKAEEKEIDRLKVEKEENFYDYYGDDEQWNFMKKILG